jgi:hypothetical protein
MPDWAGRTRCVQGRQPFSNRSVEGVETGVLRVKAVQLENVEKTSVIEVGRITRQAKRRRFPAFAMPWPLQGEKRFGLAVDNLTSNERRVPP